MTQTTLDIDTLDFDKGNGLVIVVAQDARTNSVLMVAHADREALALTLATGEMHYHSRTRGLWRKGGQSGNVQRVVSLVRDCDGDTVLARVVPAGPACHTGETTCFGCTDGADPLSALDRTISERAGGAEPGSYTHRLLNDRNLRLKKLGEECAELVTALADGDAARAVEEASDFVYHMLVALHAAGAGITEIRATLAARVQAGNTQRTTAALR